MDKAVLLTGPLGTGKTTYARRLANNCGTPLVIGSSQEWQGDRDGHLGHALGAMQRTFREARAAAPCILFLDEIDSMDDHARFDERHRGYSTAYLNGLMEQLDGLQGCEGVIVVAACNHPDRLDPALKRSGRLDRMLGIPLPDECALTGILRQQLGDDLPGADLPPNVRPRVGATGADVERWVRSARRRARHAGRPISIDDLLAEIRPKNSTSLRIRRRAAVHEAGHVLVAWLDEPGSILRASLTTEATTGGITEHRHEALLTRDAIRRHRRLLLRGRAAEELVFAEVSSGAGGSPESDLAKATLLAVGAVSSWDLGSARGGMPLLWRGQLGHEEMRLLFAHQPSLETEVAAMLEGAYGQARAMIDHHRPALQRIACTLIDYEVVTAKEMRRCRRGRDGDAPAASAKDAAAAYIAAILAKCAELGGGSV